MNTTRSRSSSRRLISCTRAVSVAATNRRETADLLVAAAACSTVSPTGSSPARYRRDDRPASIFSIAIRPRISVEENRS